MHVRQLALMDR